MLKLNCFKETKLYLPDLFLLFSACEQIFYDQKTRKVTFSKREENEKKVGKPQN